MVESGIIDSAHHRNFASKALTQVLQLEKAVEAAIKAVDLDETLIMVTADHGHTLTMSGEPKRGTDIRGEWLSPHSLGWTPRQMMMFHLIVLGHAGFGTQVDPEGDLLPILAYANGPGARSSLLKTSADAIVDPDHAHPALYQTPTAKHGGQDVSIFASGAFKVLTYEY